MSVDIQRRAEIDLELAADDLRRAGPAAVARFEQRFARILALLELSPQMAELYDPPDPRYPGLRAYAPARFGGHVIFYQPTADGITVVRVLHGSMNVRAVFGPRP